MSKYQIKETGFVFVLEKPVKIWMCTDINPLEDREIFFKNSDMYVLDQQA